MKAAIKLALRRLVIPCLRKLVDIANDRLHAAEVKLRKEIPNGALDHCAGCVGVPHRAVSLPVPRMARQKEARRLGVTQAPSAVKMAANLKAAGMSTADAASAMRNLGFNAREVGAVLS
jgi:hypothetical protein